MYNGGISKATRRFRPGKSALNTSCLLPSPVLPGSSQRVGSVAAVPRISAFYGVAIATYFPDHPPPHFHARYAEYEATVDIATGTLLSGALPPRARRMVQEWGPPCTGPSSKSNWQRPIAESL